MSAKTISKGKEKLRSPSIQGETKICAFCKSEYGPRTFTKLNDWAKRTCCSSACAGRYGSLLRRSARLTSIVRVFDESGAVVVPVNPGRIALVDPLDADRVLERSWQLQRSRSYDVPVTTITVDSTRRPVIMSRFVLGCSDGDGLVIDHINRNPSDNRRSNLRFATRRENQGNLRSSNMSRGEYKGVRRARESTWEARLAHRYIGSFRSPEEAARAYDAAARDYFGPFALVNFPGELP